MIKFLVDKPFNNQWYFNNIGNYWDDYKDKCPGAIDKNNDGFWDSPYVIYQNKMDLFQLVQSIKILLKINKIFFINIIISKK